jgi:hypothetical protein
MIRRIVSFAVVGLWMIGCGASSDSSDDPSSGNSAVSVGPATVSGTSPVCRSEEQTLFSCRTTTKKLIAVCASRDLSTSNGYIQYRFGSDNKIEIKVPEDAEVKNFRQVTTFTGGDPQDQGMGFIDRNLQFQPPDPHFA